MRDKKTILQKDYDSAIELLSKDKLSNVLDLLDELGVDVILLKGRYTRDKAENLANRQSQSDYSVIGKAILELIKTLTIDEALLSKKQPVPTSSPMKKNILENNTISSDGNLNIHTGDIHNHFYQKNTEDEQLVPDKKTVAVSLDSTLYINTISDSNIFKLEKYLIMSSKYQYSFSNPKYKILSFHYLGEFITKLETSRNILNKMDLNILFYSNQITTALERESNILEDLENTLRKSKLEDSHLFSLVNLTQSFFSDVIERIDCQELGTYDGVLFLNDKRLRLMEEIKRVQSIASKYSLS